MTTPSILTVADRQILLELVRATLKNAARRLPPGSISAPATATSALFEKSGAFVTVNKAGSLRGCIGTLRRDQPLWEAVRDSAWSAAREDQRFVPLAEDELNDVAVEISVLSPLTEISSVERFIPVEHGIVIEKDRRRGVFLPKVAEEMAWSREEMLSALCKKAGLPVNAWQLPGARFWIFTVEVIAEQS